MLILQEESSNLFLDWFIPEGSRGIAGAQDTAMSWVLSGIVIAVLMTGGMIFLKWLLKERAPLPRKRWVISKVLLYMLTGLLPVFAILWALYYLNDDFKMILEIGGFFKGVLFTWSLYIFFMIGMDLLASWSRPDYVFKKRRA
jgi:hypothetical protein